MSKRIVWAEYVNDLPVRIFKVHKKAIQAQLAGRDVRETDFAQAMGSIRKQVYIRDHGECQDCGKKLPLNGSVFQRAHFAHIKGRGQGGEDSVENGQILCHDCHIIVQHCGWNPV